MLAQNDEPCPIYEERQVCGVEIEIKYAVQHKLAVRVMRRYQDHRIPHQRSTWLELNHGKGLRPNFGGTEERNTEERG